MKNKLILRKIAAVTLMASIVAGGAGCGNAGTKSEVNVGVRGESKKEAVAANKEEEQDYEYDEEALEQDADEYASDEEWDETYEDDEYEDEADGSGLIFPDYPRDNTVTEYDDSNVTPMKVDGSLCVDPGVFYEAQQNGNSSDIDWIMDTVVNKIEPQAVEKLMQIPVFKEAAEEGRVGFYMVPYLDYNTDNMYEAMVQSCNIGRNYEVASILESPCLNIGQRLLLNQAVFEERAGDREGLLLSLEDTVIHEMTHAFMNDVMRNGSIGTDRNGNAVLETDENGQKKLDEYGDPIFTNSFPSWFCEGVATSTQAGYTDRREEILEFFGYPYDYDDAMDAVTDRDAMQEYIDQITEIDEFENLEGKSAIDLRLSQNDYTVGYLAAMYLYYMAAEFMGDEVFDDNNNMSTEALLNGMNLIFSGLVTGSSLDEVIRTISTDEETGETLYENTEDFESSFMYGADEPGMMFVQRMLLFYEHLVDEYGDGFIPSGSVLPGYVNGKQHYLDSKYHEAAPVFRMVINDKAEMYVDYFVMSTVLPSDVALTGGRSITYSEENDAFSEQELNERDAVAVSDDAYFVSIEE